MSQRIRFTLGLAAVFCTAIGASAQSSCAFQHDITWPWPETLGTSGTLTSSACADVTGDARPDVFVRYGASTHDIAFFGSPGLAVSSKVLGVPCNDLCIGPGAGASGLNVLVYVDQYGLKRLDYMTDSQTFDSPTNISLTSYWQGAHLVRSADVNWSGVADYVGVLGTNQIVYRRDTSPGVFTESSFTASSTIQDIQLVRWLGSGAHLAVAIRLATGMEVRELASGTSLGSYIDPSWVTDAMAIVPSGGNLVDRIAVLARIDAGTETLLTFKRTSWFPEVNIVITENTSLIGASLAAGDMDGDKDYDLVATWTTTHDVHVFENTAGPGVAPLFTMDEEEQAISTWSFGSEVLANQADVVFKDVDGDGKADILSPLRRQDENVEGELACLKRQISTVGVCDAFPDPDAIIDANGNLTISGLIGKALDLTGLNLESSDRYFEVLVWTQVITDPPLLTTETQPLALAYLLYPIDSSLFETLPEIYPELTFSEIPMEPGQNCMGGVVRFVEFREVIWYEGRTLYGGPTFTAALTADDGMNELFDDAGCPHPYFITNCSSGSDGPTVRSRPRRPPPLPNTPVELPEVIPVTGGVTLSVPEEQ